MRTASETVVALSGAQWALTGAQGALSEPAGRRRMAENSHFLAGEGENFVFSPELPELSLLGKWQ